MDDLSGVDGAARGRGAHGWVGRMGGVAPTDEEGVGVQSWLESGGVEHASANEPQTYVAAYVCTLSYLRT